MTVKTAIGNITATKETLNALSIYLDDAGKFNEARGYRGLAKQCTETAKEILDALSQVGFYDEIIVGK